MTTRSNLDEAEQAAVAAAERLGVPLELIPCDPAYADTAAFCAQYGYPVERAANTLVVASKKEPKQYAACVVLATTRLDVNHAVRDLLGAAKCSFASAEEMSALTGMKVGGVTAFGLPEGLPLYVDARVHGSRLGHPRHRGPQRQDPHRPRGVPPDARGQGRGGARGVPAELRPWRARRASSSSWAAIRGSSTSTSGGASARRPAWRSSSTAGSVSAAAGGTVTGRRTTVESPIGGGPPPREPSSSRAAS